MKKGLVIGGASGIGLALAHKLHEEGYYPIILDINEPHNIECEFHKFNLLEIDDQLLISLAEDEMINVLVITAGVGWVCGFENLHPVEIDKIMTINATATLKIFRYFYQRINSKKVFYCGVMGSIAGLVSSPLFSIYAASKAAVCRFVESVNIELEKNESVNRILNISPGSILGTSFNGGVTELSLLRDLAGEIINQLQLKKTLYIPKYDEVFKKVITDYIEDPISYGMHSYEYKTKSNRVYNKKNIKIGYMSGTFDLFHMGHLNVIKHAKENCDYLIVGVHKDASHKGKETFIPFEERMAIVAGCKYVDKVVPSTLEDSDAVFKYGANRLFVGSDYKGSERFEKYELLFKDKGIEIMYFPYTKGTSSTQIRKRLILKE